MSGFKTTDGRKEKSDAVKDVGAADFLCLKSSGQAPPTVHSPIETGE